jgi:hypothetical protein
MAFLTDRSLATGVTLQDLIHIVITGDTSQGNPDGSSYKATIGQVSDAILPSFTATSLYEVGVGIDSTQRKNVTADARGDCSLVSGGYGNTALGNCSVVSGGYLNTSIGNVSSVSGGYGNTTNGDLSSVSGGYLNTVSSNYSTIGGGDSNTLSSYNSFIGGGYSNKVDNLDYSTIGGGCYNNITGEGSSSVIGGGGRNTINGTRSFIGGGAYNYGDEYSVIGGGCGNTIRCNYSTIGGGFNNSTYRRYSTIVGGCGNTIYSTTPTYDGQVINGGALNWIDGEFSIIGGGTINSAVCEYSIINGGRNNETLNAFSIISGGFGNTASGLYSFIGGGCENTTTHQYSSIVGKGVYSVSACTFHTNYLALQNTPAKDSTNNNILVRDPFTGVVKERDISNTLHNYGIYYSIVDQPIGSVGTTYTMSAETQAATSGIVLINGGRYELTNGGTYNIQFSAQLEKNSGTKSTVWIWLYKNGSNLSYSNTEVTLDGAINDRVVAAWNFVETFSENEYFEIRWASSETNTFLSYDGTPTYGPEIPSVILTITQVA